MTSKNPSPQEQLTKLDALVNAVRSDKCELETANREPYFRQQLTDGTQSLETYDTIRT